MWDVSIFTGGQEEARRVSSLLDGVCWPQEFWGSLGGGRQRRLRECLIDLDWTIHLKSVSSGLANQIAEGSVVNWRQDAIGMK